jgi:hypothetical protein
MTRNDLIRAVDLSRDLPLIKPAQVVEIMLVCDRFARRARKIATTPSRVWIDESVKLRRQALDRLGKLGLPPTVNVEVRRDWPYFTLTTP